MEILWWLLPAGVATTVAAGVAAYAGRTRVESADPQAGLDAVGEALRRDLPRAG